MVSKIPNSEMKMVKKIISIDGGALAGVIPLAVCIAIENETGKQLKDIFDLFVGTSTGALITSAAVRGIIKDRTNSDDSDGERAKGFGMKANDILQVYYDQADFIFGDDAINPGNTNIPILNVTKYPKYNPARLITVIRDVFGGGGIVQLDKASKKLSISAYDVTARKPCFFRSWTGKYKGIQITDAVMASSTVPNSHPVHKIEDNYFIDGGVFASNPAMFALMDAFSLYGDEELILVSLGTGTSPKDREQLDEPKDNLAFWLENIFGIFLDGQAESTEQLITGLANSNPKIKYFRFNIDLDSRDSTATELEVLKSYHQKMKDSLDNDVQIRTQFEQLIKML